MPNRARWRPQALTTPPPQRSLRVTNALGGDGAAACLYLYGPIDEMGAEWGAISATEFVAALRDIQATHIELRVSSQGGSFFEAVTMRAALVAHPATVTAYVDGMAASAASVLVTGADRVIMSRGSQQMIHCASTFAIGNAAQLRADADLLEKVDRDIAGFYAERSGQGTVDSWLTAMSTETWMSADEAVAAGLADEIAPDPVRQRDTEQGPVAASADHWILATYRYAGRDKAPAPTVTAEAPAAAPMSATELAETSALLDEDEPAENEPPPLTSPLLDDDAIARIAEAVAQRLAPPAPEASGGESGGNAPESGGAVGNVIPLPAPETPVTPVAAALPPTALPTAGSPAPQFDPAQFRVAIRKAAS